MPEDTKQFRLRYVGDRFNGGRLPVDILSDLPAFRDVLVAFAKDKWRKINQRRKRVPKGFDKSININLIGVEDGSAIPVMVWDKYTAQTNLPGLSEPIEELVDESFSDFVKLIDEAGSGRYPESLSKDHIGALNKLGAGLKEGERIEFPDTRGNDGNVVYLDQYRRKQLITHVKETYQTRYEGFGKLEANAANGVIKVAVPGLGVIDIEVGAEEVITVFDGNLGADVQLDILVELDNSDKYRGIKEIYHVSIVDDRVASELIRCKARLLEISELQDGWRDGEGLRASEKSISAANSFLSKRPMLSGVYRIYPTLDGGVLFEFNNDGWDLAVEFFQDGSVELYGVQIDGAEEIAPIHFTEVGGDFFVRFDEIIGR